MCPDCGVNLSATSPACNHHENLRAIAHAVAVYREDSGKHPIDADASLRQLMDEPLEHPGVYSREVAIPPVHIELRTREAGEEDDMAEAVQNYLNSNDRFINVVAGSFSEAETRYPFHIDPRCRADPPNHNHLYCSCAGQPDLSPEHQALKASLSVPAIDQYVKHLFYKIHRMETGLADSIRLALYKSEQGDAPQTNRILRNVLGELKASPDGGLRNGSPEEYLKPCGCSSDEYCKRCSGR